MPKPFVSANAYAPFTHRAHTCLIKCFQMGSWKYSIKISKGGKKVYSEESKNLFASADEAYKEAQKRSAEWIDNKIDRIIR